MYFLTYSEKIPAAVVVEAAAAVATRLFCLSMALYCAAVTEAVAAARVKVAAANSSNSLFALLQGLTLSSTTCTCIS